MRPLFLIAWMLCMTGWPWQIGLAQTSPVPSTAEQNADAAEAATDTNEPPIALPMPLVDAPAQPETPAVTPPAPPTPAPAVVSPPPPQVKPPSPPPAPAKQTVGVIDFQGTPVQAVLDYYAQNLAKRSIIAAPNLAGVIWFRSLTDLTIDEAQRALDTVLAMNGIAIIPFGEKFLKVVQIATAKQEAPPFIGEGRTQPASDALMTQVIPVKYAEPAEVVGALQPFLHAYGQIIPLPKSSSILISETAANVNQMLEIVKVIDVPSALRMETRVIILKNAKAAEVVQRLQAIIQETQQAGGRPTTGGAPAAPVPPGVRAPVARPGAVAASAGTGDESVVEGKVVLTSDERTNKMFILSRASNFPFFEKIIAELDAKVEPDITTKVIQLEYATAEDVASLMNSLISGGSPTFTQRRTGTSTTTTGGRTSAPPPPSAVSAVTGGTGADTGLLEFSQGVRILPDPRTNTLLVMATKEDMLRIEKLIKSIDASVAQVQIETVIAEVTLNNELDVGVNVFKRLFDAGQTTQAGASRPDGSTTPIQLPRFGDTISALASNVPGPGAFAAGGLTYLVSFQNLGLDAVVRALSRTANNKILSTPVIQTMDNQEASILVGQSVPVPVSQVSSLVGGSGTLATGQLNSNIEYKDAAIELIVTPRISPGGYVRMEITQKVNDFGPAVLVNGSPVPSILKREAKSAVAVQDRSTIVLGGLIKENKDVTESKVPFFGDIPFFGTLFKSKSTSKIRTELLIFVRPVVMRTDKQAVAAARMRARLLKSSDVLELDKRFDKNKLEEPVSDDAPGSPVAPPAAPVENSQGPANDTTSTSEDIDRYTAKVKALQEQTPSPSN